MEGGRSGIMGGSSTICFFSVSNNSNIPRPVVHRRGAMSKQFLNGTSAHIRLDSVLYMVS